MSTTLRHHEISGPNGPIGVVEAGTGSPLVLVAGLGSTHSIWGDLPRVLGRYLRVVALDNRGVGASREGERFSLARAAEDVSTVMDTLQLERCALLGISMGGLIALHAALVDPQRIERIVVGSCAAHLSTHGRRAIELLRDLLEWVPPQRMGANLMTLAFAPPFIEQYTALVDQAGQVYGLPPEDLPGARAQIEDLLTGWDLRPHLRRLSCPALVLAGRRDPIVAFEDTVELADGLPQAELFEAPDAAHSVLAEGGAVVLSHLMRFLGISEELPGLDG